jgi:hypothetical protein
MGKNMSGDGEEPAAPSPLAGSLATAQADYENPAISVKGLAERLNTSVSALVAHARKAGWKLRNARKTRAESSRQTIARLKDLLQKRLAHIEGQLDAMEAEVSAISSERDIRAMNTLVRTLEKVLELERKERNQRSRRTREHRKFDDAERDALAARLEGLHRQWQLEQAEPGLAAGEREEPEP